MYYIYIYMCACVNGAFRFGGNWRSFEGFDVLSFSKARDTGLSLSLLGPFLMHPMKTTFQNLSSGSRIRDTFGFRSEIAYQHTNLTQSLFI